MSALGFGGFEIAYDVRFFDRQGRFSHSRSLRCSGNDEAIKIVAELPYQTLELWRADALVARLAAPNAGGSRGAAAGVAGG